jgi:hypothetical protein
MTLTKALWPPFLRPYWPQCACSEVCETDGFRHLLCHACGQSAERALPAKLKVGEEACAAIDRAERLIAQLDVMGFRAQLGADGALGFADTTPERRDFARMCPTAYCFAVINAALDVDPGFVAVAVRRPSKKQRIARAGRDRFAQSASKFNSLQLNSLYTRTANFRPRISENILRNREFSRLTYCKMMFPLSAARASSSAPERSVDRNSLCLASRCQPERGGGLLYSQCALPGHRVPARRPRGYPPDVAVCL